MGSKVIVAEVKTRTYNLELTQGEADALYTILSDILQGDIVSSLEAHKENSLFLVWDALYRTNKVKSLNIETSLRPSTYNNDSIIVKFKK